MATRWAPTSSKRSPLPKKRIPKSIAQKSYISRLPNELLLDIFDIIIPESRAADNWKQDVVYLRSTCHRFRALVRLLKIWKSPAFSLSQIELSRPSSPEALTDFKYRGFPLLRGIEADPVLYQTLKSREEWTVGSVEMVVELLRYFPIIAQNLKRFTIKNFEHCLTMAPTSHVQMTKTVRRAFLLLADCPNLKFLQIRSDHHRQVPFEFLYPYIPALKRLSLSDNSYTGWKLGGFCSVEHLCIDDWNGWSLEFHVNFLVNVLKRAVLLKSLSISYSADVTGDPLYLDVKITGLVNLTWLNLTPFTESIYTKLASSNLPNLRAFLTHIYCESDASLSHIKDLLNSLTFNRLHILSILVEPCCPYSEMRNYLWNAITESNISPKLEYLELSLGLVTIWLQDITKLSELKGLYWKVAREECVISDDPTAMFYWESGLEEVEEWSSGEVVTGEMIEKEAAKFLGGRFMPRLNFYVLEGDNFHWWRETIFELEEKGFDSEPLDCNKILKINTEKLCG